MTTKTSSLSITYAQTLGLSSKYRAFISFCRWI